MILNFTTAKCELPNLNVSKIFDQIIIIIIIIIIIVATTYSIPK